MRPETIAVIGGGFWCANVIEQCRKIGFEGKIWPVHPSRTEIGGISAFSGIEELPGAPDATFIGINRDLTVEAVRLLSKSGAGGAVCFASGFKEAQLKTSDGASLEQELLEAAGAMTILGPNCYGLLNYMDGVALWPDQHGGERVEKGVAIIAQSSNIAVNLTMQHRGLPIAYVVTCGNQAQTSLAQIALTLLEDDRVTALGLHIEGIGSLREFEIMAHRASELGKPLVAIKIGRSEQAQKGALSHTASLSGSDAGATALFERLRVGEVHSLDEFLETLKILHVFGALPSNRIVSLSCSGGEAGLVADNAQILGLELPALSADQKTGLVQALGPRVALSNPLDYHTYIWGDVEAMCATFSAMMQGDFALGCVILDFPRADRCDPAAWEPVITAVEQTLVSSGPRMAIVATLPEAMPEETAKRLIKRGIVPLCGLMQGLTAIRAGAKRAVAADALIRI